MARTNQGLVRGILDKDYNGTTPLKPFIDTASIQVDNLVSYAESRSIDIQDSTLEMIERWLSAHAYVTTDQVTSEETIGQARAKYQGQTGLGLDNSKYGQMAKSLDPTGYLKSLDKIKVTKKIVWGGKSIKNQIPYEQK